MTKDNRYLLAVNEMIDSGNNNSGYIESFLITNNGHKLSPVNKVSSEGALPCYVSVNDNGDVLAANYAGGSVALFKLEVDGVLSKAIDVQQHYGNGPNKERQEGPHVHSTFFEPKQIGYLSRI